MSYLDELRSVRARLANTTRKLRKADLMCTELLQALVEANGTTSKTSSGHSRIRKARAKS